MNKVKFADREWEPAVLQESKERMEGLILKLVSLQTLGMMSREECFIRLRDHFPVAAQELFDYAVEKLSKENRPHLVVDEKGILHCIPESKSQ